MVFADEPFSNLDPDNAEQAMEILKQWLHGRLVVSRPDRTRTLILICHDRDLAWRHGDSFLLMGRKVHQVDRANLHGCDELRDIGIGRV